MTLTRVVLNTIGKQSPVTSTKVLIKPDPKRSQGAGDQGIMFGYATNETRSILPAQLLTLTLLWKQAGKYVRAASLTSFSCLDAKSQVTFQYDQARLLVSTQLFSSTQHLRFSNNTRPT
ncbi:hypothetical protein O9929_07195 [Vibrio lentus]|nr:hypothetical protein [Vibrio lentus]